MKSYLLIGNFGVGNLGDEALREYFLERFPEVQWKVVSASPEKDEFPRFPCGFRSLFFPWWRTLRALRQSDGVVFGGGSLCTDVESVFACIIWWWHACIARVFRKPIYLTFQGIGPFRTKLGERLTRQMVRWSSFVSVRDEASRKRIESWHLNKEVVQTFDPVISLIEGIKTDSSSKNLLILIPRKNSGDRFRKKVHKLMEQSDWKQIRILSLQPRHHGERAFCFALEKELGDRAVVLPVSTLQKLVAEVSSGSFILSERYHGALVALALKKKLEIVEQEERDKLEGLRKAISSSVDVLCAQVDHGEKMLKSILDGSVM